jgi:hypothetical protein
MVVKPLRRTKKGDPGTRGWSNLSYASILRRALGDSHADFEGQQTLYERGDHQWCADVNPLAPPAAPARQDVTPLQVHLPRTISGSRRSWPMVAPSSLSMGAMVLGEDLLKLEAVARQRGTLWHKWLEHVEFLDESDGLPTPEQFRQIALAAGFDDESWLANQLRQFTATLTRPSVHQLLTRGDAYELWRERRFAVRDGDRLLTGSFDRVTLHRHPSGEIDARIIDFKTDRVSPDNLPPVIDHYRPQVDAYRRALAQLLKVDCNHVQAALVFLDAGQAVHL